MTAASSPPSAPRAGRTISAETAKLAAQNIRANQWRQAKRD
jgi:hypothetical protein